MGKTWHFRFFLDIPRWCFFQGWIHQPGRNPWWSLQSSWWAGCNPGWMSPSILGRHPLPIWRSVPKKWHDVIFFFFSVDIYTLSCCNSFELKVVLAMFMRSSLNLVMSWELSRARDWRVSLATSLAILQPLMMCWGWIFMATSFSPSLNSSPARTATVVVPSPTSSSWVFEISKGEKKVSLLIKFIIKKNWNDEEIFKNFKSSKN